MVTNHLAFSELKSANQLRCERDFNERLDDTSTYTPADWVLSVVEETGEIAGAILGATGKKRSKKHLTMADVGNEIADAVIYLDLLATRLGMNLGDLVVAKFNATSARMDPPSDIRLGVSQRTCVGPGPEVDARKVEHRARRDERLGLGLAQTFDRSMAGPEGAPAAPASDEVCEHGEEDQDECDSCVIDQEGVARLVTERDALKARATRADELEDLLKGMDAAIPELDRLAADLEKASDEAAYLKTRVAELEAEKAAAVLAERERCVSAIIEELRKFKLAHRQFQFDEGDIRSAAEHGEAAPK